MGSSSFHELHVSGPALLALCLLLSPHVLQQSPGEPAGFGGDLFDMLLEASRHQSWSLLHSTGPIHQVPTLVFIHPGHTLPPQSQPRKCLPGPPGDPHQGICVKPCVCPQGHGEYSPRPLAIVMNRIFTNPHLSSLLLFPPSYRWGK